MLEVNAEDGSVRTIVEDSSPTFIVYNRIYRNKINNDKELIWSSERDNHNHLYLYDMKTGKIKNKITKGEWYVRDIVNIDEENKEIIFSANGVDKDEDP